MGILLRLTALSCLVWAALLLGLKDRLVATEQLTAVARALANSLGLTQLVLAYVFWSAAKAPALHLKTIYAAMFLLAAKTANDLYDVLVLLPASEALASVLDLIVSVALLVGLLEALPRTLRDIREGG